MANLVEANFQCIEITYPLPNFNGATAEVWE